MPFAVGLFSLSSTRCHKPSLSVSLPLVHGPSSTLHERPPPLSLFPPLPDLSPNHREHMPKRPPLSTRLPYSRPRQSQSAPAQRHFHRSAYRAVFRFSAICEYDKCSLSATRRVHSGYRRLWATRRAKRRVFPLQLLVSPSPCFGSCREAALLERVGGRARAAGRERVATNGAMRRRAPLWRRVQRMRATHVSLMFFQLSTHGQNLYLISWRPRVSPFRAVRASTSSPHAAPCSIARANAFPPSHPPRPPDVSAIAKPVMDDSLARHGREYNLHSPTCIRLSRSPYTIPSSYVPFPHPLLVFPFEPTRPPRLAHR